MLLVLKGWADIISLLSPLFFHFQTGVSMYHSWHVVCMQRRGEPGQGELKSESPQLTSVPGKKWSPACSGRVIPPAYSIKNRIFFLGQVTCFTNNPTLPSN